MNIIKQVTMSDLIFADNADYLTEEYAKAAKIDQVVVPNRPDHEYYLMLEEKGFTDCIGVYNDDVLVGLMIIMHSIMPHYSALCTTIETQFILPEHRSHGTGKRMMELATLMSKQRGSVNMFMSAPIGGTLEIVARSFGFTPTNTTFTKEL